MRKRGFLILLGIVTLMALINVIAWESTAFCDFYVRNIYPLCINLLGRVTELFPFSVGEMMIVAGVIITAGALLTGITALLCLPGYRRTKGESPAQGNFPLNKKSGRYAKIMNFCKKYAAAYACIFTGVAVVMTLNCFIPYHCSAMEEKYGLLSQMPVDDPVLKELMTKDYTVEELGQLRDYVVIKANKLAKQVDRDENGDIIYPDNMEELAVECMQNLSKDCDQLSGYYPRPKEFTFSGFFSQQKMKGYFFPFSMEVNYNGIMHEINRPATICHEYAHLKGFMYEEEANMIGFLACINSSDVTFQYSGYLSILNYINNEFYDAIGRNKSIYAAHVKISPEVVAENVFLEKKAWEKVEAKAVIKTEVVDKVSDKLAETSMVLNGVEDGILSYTRVVGLLLNYYDGSPEVQNTLIEADYMQEYLVQSE